MESTPQWYIAQDGQPSGPFFVEDMLARARDGTLQPDQLVWHPSFGSEWKPAQTVEGLSDAFPVTPSIRAGTAATTPNGEITRRARAALKGHWAEMVGITLVWLVLSLVLQVLGMVIEQYVPLVGTLAVYVLTVPLAVGWLRVTLRVADGAPPRFDDLFSGFSRWGTGLLTQLLVQLLLFLWGVVIVLPVVAIILLFGLGAGHRHELFRSSGGPMAIVFAVLVAGAVVALIAVMLRYFFALWVVADDAEAGPVVAVRRSVQLTQGRKWKLIRFFLRFFGWACLALLTCGLGFLFYIPYTGVAMALWYRDALPPES